MNNSRTNYSKKKKSKKLKLSLKKLDFEVPPGLGLTKYEYALLYDIIWTALEEPKEKRDLFFKGSLFISTGLDKYVIMKHYKRYIRRYYDHGKKCKK